MKTISVAIFFSILIVLKILKIIEIETKYIFVLAVLSILLTYDYNNTEHLENAEAIQALASVYNTGKAVLGELEVNKLTVRGEANIGGRFTSLARSDFGDDVRFGNNKWVIHVPADNIFRVAPIENDWGAWEKGFMANAGGDLFVKRDLVLDGSNSWILHTPNDGRKSMYITPKGTGDWDWGNSIEMTNNKNIITGIKNDGFVGFFGDASGHPVPIYVGQGVLTDLSVNLNSEDYITIAPGYGVKLWDAVGVTDWTTGEVYKFENTTNNWKHYNLWGSNRCDYWKAYRL